MAKVKIADVIEPAKFTQYVIEKLTEMSALVQSGIVRLDPELDALAKQGGRTINMPFWQRVSGSSEVLSDGVALTPVGASTAQDVATLIMRGKAFSSNDLASAVAGSDPMAAIGSQVADFWRADQQTTLVNILAGLFKASGQLRSTHVNAISIEDGDAAVAANKFSDNAFLDTVFKLGDHQEDFTAVVCHSTILRKMLELDLVEDTKPSGSDKSIYTYRGRRVIVDDSTLKIAGSTSGYHYYTFVFGEGALGYGEGAPAVGTETARDALAGDDYLVSRRHYILHPRGVKWTGSPAGSSPTDAELATVGNWSKVYSDKNIKIAALVTNG